MVEGAVADTDASSAGNQPRSLSHDAAPEDSFLATFIGSAALLLALKSGLVDRLGQGPQQLTPLAGNARLNPRGVELLAGLLESAGVPTLTVGTLCPYPP